MMNPFLVMAGIGFVKALVVSVVFALNVGVILTWVERRMRGMIQDSVGPNRAAIPLPGVIAAGVATGPAFLLAGAVLWAGFASSLTEDGAEGQGFYGKLFLQGGIFLGWVTLAGIARVSAERGPANQIEAAILRLGSPRLIAIFGLCAHGVALIFSSVFGASESGSKIVLELGALALAGMAVLGAGHVGASLAKQKIVRVTLLGLLHPAADGLKTAFKADFIPPKSDKLLYNLAPWIAFFPALVLLAVVPFGPALCFGKDGKNLDFSNFQGIEAPGHMCEAGRLSLQVADLNVGILYFFAMAGTGIVGAALAGWASDNKFSLLGGMRAASQMVSYEVTMGLTIVGLLMIYGTVRVDEMVLWQANHAWGIFVQPLAFFLFMAAAIAETKRVPFDIPEGESEIVAGFYTEYSGMKFAMFFFSEFIAVVSSSALISALFLGGWHMPFMTSEGLVMTIGGTELFRSEIPPGVLVVLGALAFVGKTISLCVLQVIIRWTLPRFRYDQLMRLGWRKLLPVSLLNVLLTAIGILGAESLSPSASRGLLVAGELSMAIVMLVGAGSIVALAIYLLVPRHKQLVVATSAARFARALGGTHEAKLEA
jgi:NADH-quinone oxidoreductase subunit H